MDNRELNRILKNLRIIQQENDELSLKIINRIKSLERQQKSRQLIFIFSLIIIILVNSIVSFKVLKEELELLSIDAIIISLIENWQLFLSLSLDVFWALLENIPFYSFSLILINLVLIIYAYKFFKNLKFFKFLIKI